MSYRIEGIDRLTNSRNGNPRFALAVAELDDEGRNAGPIEVINTAADAGFNYEIGNLGYRVGDVVLLTIGGRGTVIDIEALPDMESSVRS